VSLEEWTEGKNFMFLELHPYSWNSPIRKLLWKAIEDFEAGKFSYDGATFVRERSKSLFEVAAFIHDWRNSMGYVSYAIDNEMFDIMITLQYRSELIFSRYILTRLTFINVIRHKLRKTFVSSVPDNLYRLT
jgi:hypothetical protein